MLWNKRIAVLLLGAFASCPITSALAAEVCPSKSGTFLRFLDVFDGSPEELATLIPEEVTEQTGYWKLGYVYDAGRFVTIRCEYADKQVLDVKLSKRIEQCDYTIDSQSKIHLDCK
ncbi:MAG: hypothetical protein LBE59_02770 [Nevskiaceae bacterium]|nr:hypothetical protein [Nevskiaceae bacterium]